MQTLGLSSSDLALYLDTLSATHTERVQVRVLNLDGDLVRSIDPLLMDGQVDIDTSAEVTRSASLGVLDPSRSLQFDTDSPGDGAVYFDNMVQVRVGVKVPTLGRVWCSVFTGPIVGFNRTGDDVSLECQGKEALARNGVPTYTLPRGKKAVDAIHDILADCCGETRFSLPSNRSARLPDKVTVSWEDGTWPWQVAQRIAKSLNLHLYYDGRGVCVLRKKPGKPVVRFTTGEGGNITGAVEVSHDKSAIRNQVLVVGKRPAHKATATLPNWHPFSPYRLRRNGVRTYLRERIEDDSIGSVSAAKRRAEAALDQYRALQFGTTLKALPVYPLDELDLFRIVSDDYTGSDRVRQLSIPIGGGDMTVGFNDYVKMPKRARRRP